MTIYRFYCDIIPGVDVNNVGLNACTKPTTKVANNRRVSFDVNIPDVMVHDVDLHVDTLLVKERNGRVRLRPRDDRTRPEEEPTPEERTPTQRQPSRVRRVPENISEDDAISFEESETP